MTEQTIRIQKPQNLEELLEMSAIYVQRNIKLMWQPANGRKRECNLNADILKTPCRKRENVLARSFFFHYARKIWPEKSLKRLGRYVNIDHSCVIHALRTLEGESKSVKLHLSLFGNLLERDSIEEAMSKLQMELPL